MKFSSLKLAGALLASFAMVSAGSAWSATDAPKAEVKSVAKHKVKAKAKIKARVHAKTGKAVVAAAVAAPVAVAMVPAVMVPVAVAPVVATVSETVIQPSPVQASYAPPAPSPAAVGNPYLAYQHQQQHQQQAGAPVSVNPWDSVGKLGSNLKSLLPSIPEGQSILPSIKKVYPTGEKPLVVLTFKCPTELIGITPIPIKLLHEGVNGVFDVVNATNLLSFNMQQVCQ